MLRIKPMQVLSGLFLSVASVTMAMSQKELDFETLNSTQSDSDFLIIKMSASKMKLIETLAAKSSKYVSPAAASDRRVTVLATVVLLNTDYSDSNEELAVDMWLYLQWNDPRLKWDPEMYAGIRESHLGVDMIWTPDVMFINNIRASMQESQRGRYAVVQYTGRVSFVSFHPVQVACQLDATDFPRDHISCNLLLSPWTSVGGHIKLKSKIPAVRRNYVNDSKWDLVLLDTVNDENATNALEPDAVHFTVRMQRHAKGYRLLFVAPAAMLGAITPILLLLPPHSNSRPIISVLVILGLLWMTESLHDHIPSQGSTVTHLSKYYIGLMALSLATTLVVTVSDLMWWNLLVSAQAGETDGQASSTDSKLEILSWLAKLCFPSQRSSNEESILLNALSETNTSGAGRRQQHASNSQAQQSLIRDEPPNAARPVLVDDNGRAMAVDPAVEMSISKVDSSCTAPAHRVVKPAQNNGAQSLRRTGAASVTFKDSAQHQNHRVMLLRLFDRVVCSACFVIYFVLTVAYMS